MAVGGFTETCARVAVVRGPNTKIRQEELLVHRFLIAVAAGMVLTSPAAADGAHHFRAAVNGVTGLSVERYATQSDYPGTAAVVDDGGMIFRRDYAVAITASSMTFTGGCIHQNGDPAAPCAVDSNGNVLEVRKESYTFRLSYKDPATGVETNLGISPYGGDEVFTIIPESPTSSGVFPQYVSCGMPLGQGFRAQLFRQQSPYAFGDPIPKGAQEWYPATTPATKTTLLVPGTEVWVSHFELFNPNALGIISRGSVNPAVPLSGNGNTQTGYSTVAAEIAPGSDLVTVSARDCGKPIAGVAFSISRDFVASSAGHLHVDPPALDSVSSLDAYVGTTGASGSWTTTLHAGEVSSLMKYTATATNVLGHQVTAGPLFELTGFVAMTDPGANDPNIRYTGAVAGVHTSNHNGSPELHEFVRRLAAAYNSLVPAADAGSLGLNDMSLPFGGVFDLDASWTTAAGHSRHRFGTDCDIDHCVRRFSDGSCANIDYDALKRAAKRSADGILIRETWNSDNLHVQVPEDVIGSILLRETP
jgi:hypothetical protein